MEAYPGGEDNYDVYLSLPKQGPGILIAIDGRIQLEVLAGIQAVCHLQCQLIPALVENSDRHTLDLSLMAYPNKMIRMTGMSKRIIVVRASLKM